MEGIPPGTNVIEKVHVEGPSYGEARCQISGVEPTLPACVGG